MNTASPARRLLLSGEDDESRRALAEALRTDGHEIVQVPDLGCLLISAPPEFLASPDPDSFGLLVLDVQVAVHEAIPMVQGIRDRGWRMPVILVAPRSDSAARESAAALGALVFDKPLDVSTIRAAVPYLLRYRPGRS